MLAAQAQVKAYQAAMNDYVACIDAEMEAKGEEAPGAIQVADGHAAQRGRHRDGSRRRGVQRADRGIQGRESRRPAAN